MANGFLEDASFNLSPMVGEIGAAETALMDRAPAA
jgi:hypothetical protein